MNKELVKLFDLLYEIKNKRIMVVGDIFLDEYLYGKINGVSTGVKIPIIEKEKIEKCLGGAANIAGNIAGISHNVSMIGGCGQDEYGNEIKRLFEEKKVKLYTLYMNKSIVKQRIYIDNQQISRIDYNEYCECNLIDICNYVNEEKPEIIILADYQYGVINQEIIDFIADYVNDKTIIFTSRKMESFNIEKLPVIVLNSHEMNSYLKYINNDKHKMKGKEFFVTHGEKGIEYIKGDERITIHTVPKYPVNVSGAGDTVISIISLLYDSNIKIETVIKLANIAGGIAISNKLTYSLNISQVIDELYSQSIKENCEKKIIDTETAKKIVKIWKNKKEKVVFTNGCYDLIHLGHIKSFHCAKEWGTKLIVALNSDDSIRRIKGENRPINSLKERMKTLAFLEMIDMVLYFDDDTAVKMIKEIEPDVYVKGEEYREKDIPEKQYVKEIKYVPMIQGSSTTCLINKVIKSMN